MVHCILKLFEEIKFKKVVNLLASPYLHSYYSSYV